MKQGLKDEMLVLCPRLPVTKKLLMEEKS